jgi:predicted adenine nucleotide alpha hydrolase (AANH) superfamily ATPase
MKTNYQNILDETLKSVSALPSQPRLLLHACCAPCSSYVLEYLSQYFDITLLYYNPNIFPEEEHTARAEELVRLSKEMEGLKNVSVVVTDYTPQDFDAISKGLENEREGGPRCFKCYRLRLEYSAAYAKAHGFDYFTTTLSISPHKNAEVLNRIGGELSEKYGVPYLFSDFKKKNGYRRSCELSDQYGLYRQDFCGCEFSRRESESRK